MTTTVALVALFLMAVTVWAKSSVGRRDTTVHEPRRREPENEIHPANDPVMMSPLGSFPVFEVTEGTALGCDLFKQDRHALHHGALSLVTVGMESLTLRRAGRSPSPPVAPVVRS